MIPMSDRVGELLRARVGERREGWLFLSKRLKCNYLTDIGKQFRAAKEKAGLPKDFVMYCTRHDFGSRILTDTGNLAAVMKVMGHKDVRAAMHYQHPDIEIVRTALNKESELLLKSSA